jgi:hypothetical protein
MLHFVFLSLTLSSTAFMLSRPNWACKHPLFAHQGDEKGAKILATPLGIGIKFLPHLGLFFSSFSLFNLQVHKPASADLLTSQFTGELREIHPDFLSRSFVTGAQVLYPIDAHRAHMHLSDNLSLRACAF